MQQVQEMLLSKQLADITNFWGQVSWCFRKWCNLYWYMLWNQTC